MQGQSGIQQSALNSDVETISVRGHSGIQESDLDSGAEAISVQGHSRGRDWFLRQDDRMMRPKSSCDLTKSMANHPAGQDE